MDEHSKLPWEETTSPIGTEWIKDASGETVFYSTNAFTVSDTTAKRRANRRLILQCVNTLGPHLGNPRFVAAVEALAKLAADKDDPTAFEMACDFLAERAG